jgi:hypothetical protein
VLGDGEILIGDASGDPATLDVGSSTAITILGTVATGVWNGTAITGAYIDATSSPLADTKIWIGSASNVAAEFALSGDVTMTAGGAVTVADNAITLAKLEDGTQGDVLYYAASGAPARLGAGSDGDVLTSGGAGANPAWETPTTGDITGVTAGTGLSGGGTSGTVTLNVEASQTQITSVGTLSAFAMSSAGSVTARFGSTDDDCALEISSDTDEGQLSTLGFLSGSDYRGSIEFNHNTTAADQQMSLKIGDNAVQALTIDGDSFIGIGTATLNKMVNFADPAQGGETLKLHFEAISGADKWSIYAYDRTNGHYANLQLGAAKVFIQGSDGYVGINEVAPSYQLEVDGTMHCTGALSKGSGSFKIDHPIKPKTHDLVHSFVEGPRADLIYRGVVTLSDGWAEVDLDEEIGLSEGTWSALCRDPQVWVQNDSGWDAVKGSVSGSTLTIVCQAPNSYDEVSWLVVAERQDDHIREADWTDNKGRPILEPRKSDG